MIAIIVISTFSRLFFYSHHIMFKDLLTNFDYFMYGAIPAYYYVNYKEETIAFMHKIPNYIKMSLIVLSLFVVIGFSHFDFAFKKIIEPYIFGFLFSAILLITIPKENKFKISKSNIISKLGVYTYGLYLLHPIAINFIIQLNARLKLQLNENYLFIFITASSLLLVILGSIISYNVIEKRFLKLKEKV